MICRFCKMGWHEYCIKAGCRCPCHFKCNHKWVRISENRRICENCLTEQKLVINPLNPTDRRWRIVER
ncbi:MAG: hypothetical protein QXQ33_00665 [Nitrososphaerota archaeon]